MAKLFLGLIAGFALFSLALNTNAIKGGEELSNGSSQSVSAGDKQILQHALVQIISLQHASDKAELGQYACSGVIVGPKLILTSAHCFDIGHQEWQIKHQDQSFDVAKVGIHKSYKREEVFDAYWGFLLEIRLHYDLALIETKEYLPTNSLMVLPHSHRDAPVGAVMIGYGQTENMFGIGKGEGTLRIAGPVEVARSDMTRIDIKNQPVGGCLGDSGGPLITEAHGQLFILGVLSQSDCRGNTTYQKVSGQTLLASQFHWGPLEPRLATKITE